MKGVIFTSAVEYLETKWGKEEAEKILDKAGYGFKLYLPNTTYPDEELVKILQTAGELKGVELSQLLFDIGRWWVPNYGRRMYPLFFSGVASAKSFLKSMDDVHKQVTQMLPGAEPPHFEYETPAPDKLIMKYISKRKLHTFFKGLVFGSADAFGEKIEVKEINSDPYTLEITFLGKA